MAIILQDAHPTMFFGSRNVVSQHRNVNVNVWMRKAECNHCRGSLSGSDKPWRLNCGCAKLVPKLNPGVGMEKQQNLLEHQL